MSLSIYVRDERGRIVTETVDGREEQMMKVLPVNGEFPPEDFGGWKMSLWYASSFSGSLYVPEDPDFDTLKTNLADYFARVEYAPFYIMEGFQNTRSTLDFIFVEPSDVRRFAKDWGHEFRAKDDEAIARNVEIDYQRLTQKFNHTDEMMQVRAQALAFDLDLNGRKAQVIEKLAKRIGVSPLLALKYA